MSECRNEKCLQSLKNEWRLPLSPSTIATIKAFKRPFQLLLLIDLVDSNTG